MKITYLNFTFASRKRHLRSLITGSPRPVNDRDRDLDRCWDDLFLAGCWDWPVWEVDQGAGIFCPNFVAALMAHC
jgi:hypothetical protein